MNGAREIIDTAYRNIQGAGVGVATMGRLACLLAPVVLEQSLSPTTLVVILSPDNPRLCLLFWRRVLGVQHPKPLAGDLSIETTT